MTGHVQLLVKLAEAADLFRTSDGRSYATVQVKAHYEHWPVRSKQFIEWLARSNYQKTGELARLQDLREATKAIEAKTLFETHVALEVTRSHVRNACRSSGCPDRA